MRRPLFYDKMASICFCLVPDFQHDTLKDRMCCSATDKFAALPAVETRKACETLSIAYAFAHSRNSHRTFKAALGQKPPPKSDIPSHWAGPGVLPVPPGSRFAKSCMPVFISRSRKARKQARSCPVLILKTVLPRIKGCSGLIQLLNSLQPGNNTSNPYCCRSN